MPKKSNTRKTPAPASRPVTLLVGTRKGAFLLKSDRARRQWTLAGPHFLGHIVNHVALDPRDGKTLLCAARAGHLGPTVFRSTDSGRNWKEAQRPPAFPKAAEGEKGLAVDHVFWLAPGPSSDPAAWSPGGPPARPIESTSRTTTASTASSARRSAGRGSAMRCGKRSATSAFPWSSFRAP